MHKTISLSLAWICFEVAFTGCALARSSSEIAAIFNSGVAAYDAGQFDRAYTLWKSIKDEDIAAMRNLAIMLRKGQGVKKDPLAAEEMFERAAEVGLVTAQADLADMLLKGEAGPPDPKRALPLLKSAAAANHPIAEFELGQLYETGGLVPKDIDAAKRLYAAASRHGMKEAADRLAKLGPPEQEASVSPEIPLSAPLPTAVPTQIESDVPAEAGAAQSVTYMVQVGAFQSKAKADTAWEVYQASHVSILSGYFPNVQRADLGAKGTWYRLRITGFKNREMASVFCEQLKTAGSACFLPR